MRKQGAAYLLSVLLIMTLFTACGGRDMDNNQTDGMTDDAPVTISPNANQGMVEDTDGIIDREDTGSSRGRSDMPVTDRLITDANDAAHKAGDAVQRGAERMGNAVERGMDDLTEHNR